MDLSRKMLSFVAIFLHCGLLHIVWGSTEGKYTYCAYLENKTTQTRENEEMVKNFSRNDDRVKYPEQPDVMADNKTVRCPDVYNKCFTLWQAGSTNKTHFTVLKQGCWINSEDMNCQTSSCVSYSTIKNSSMRYCCCKGNKCNMNITIGGAPPTTVRPSPGTAFYYHDTSYKEKTIIISLTSVCGVALLILVSYLGFRIWLGSCKTPPDALTLVETPVTIPVPRFNMDDLKLSNMMCKGRYGEIWKASLGEMDVAVKIFTPAQKQFYLNELDIYTLPHMEHDNIVKFYGAEERLTSEGIMQQMLVLMYIPHGSLAVYLKNNTVDWAAMCRMCQSVASGLAHLHTDIQKGDKIKPAIAHRDFNTRNILVKPDLSCVITDLGFAMKIQGSKFYRNGHEENVEHAALTDVGTLRYMAPEVLDGAVNLRDCEASLKQIDVYALGLILWEIASRCSDLYQGLPVPEYKLPFQAEVGTHVSFEEMQLLVSRNKQRPAFPDVWKDTNQAIRALKETIEDCWDQDAEARLTSLCVEERVADMMALWDLRTKGLSPIVPVTSQLVSLGEKTDVQRNATILVPEGAQTMMTRVPNSSVSDMGALVHTVPSRSVVHDSCMSDPVVPLGSYMRLPPSGGVSSSRGENSVSSSTVETLLSPSEGDSAPGVGWREPMSNSKDHLNMNFAKSNKILQPHQGRNPIVERNTHKCSDEELAILGNTLVKESEQAVKRPSNNNNILSQHGAGVQHGGNSVGGGGGGHSNTDHEVDSPAGGFHSVNENFESTSLVQNDVLSHVRNNPPIPLNIQNEVHTPPLPSTRPKQANVPGNGNAHVGQAVASTSTGAGKHTKPSNTKKSRFAMFGLKSKGKGKGSSIFNGNFLSKSHQNIERNEFVDDSHSSHSHNTSSQGQGHGHQRSSSDGTTSLSSAAKCNLAAQSSRSQGVPTEVRMMNGSPIVRPTSLPVRTSGPAPQNKTALIPGMLPVMAEQNGSGGAESRLAFAEVGVAQLQPASNGQAAILLTKSNHVNSQSVTDLSPVQRNTTKDSTSYSLTDLNARRNQLQHGKDTKSKTLDMLPNNRHPKVSEEKIAGAEDNPLGSEKIRTRVKTPYQMKSGRFSLYDDRIMCDGLSLSENPSKRKGGCKISKSLSEFNSVEIGMDTL
ncbi:uncharacterized protein LOC106170149 [Lingula anatina]|uniref:receptor protein serine/threonine kinase n=1 Tax=Lingula anatina TaxID=7574 RepID=A0A1S3J510_LINAN|nr:uncharacterized protein LOC106170149 [Lingula anatina]|eukprot:XP_013405351.1 uncharacterized protein LOC106170149 [Lingula anatina]